MKRMRVAVVSLALCLALCGCRAKPGSGAVPPSEEPFVQGVWVSYTDLQALGETGDFADAFDTLCRRCTDLGLNTVLVHTTAFADSLYDSSVYPRRGWSDGQDCVAVMVNTAHRYGLKIHAWINPYRVSHDPNAVLTDPLSRRLEETDLFRCDAGTYLAPASAAARQTVIDGAAELLERYGFDGLHIDDYFYPTTEEAPDEQAYRTYCAGCERPLQRDDWRRSCTGVLAASLAALAHGRGLVFTVSPCADPDRSYGTLCADVIGWCRAGYADAVIPQLYFGFDYPDEAFAFDRLVTRWAKELSGTQTALYVGVAAYKLGTTAPADAPEWENGTDLLARELAYLYAQPTVSGAVYYSAGTLFASDTAHTAQRDNLASMIQTKETVL